MAQVPDALSWFERSIALWRTEPGHSAELTETAFGLIDVYRLTGRFGAAEQTIRSLLQVDLLNEHKAALLNILGDLLREQSRKQEAVGVFQSSLALSSVSGKRRIEAYLSLADIDRGTGDRSAALEKTGRAIALARELGFVQFEALALRVQGLTWFDAGDLAKAEPLLRHSLAMFRQQASSPRQIAVGFSSLAQLYRDQGKYSLAEDAWLNALDIERKLSGENKPQAAAFMESLAGLYSLEKRHAEAAELASRAWTIMSETFGEDSMPAAGALATIASVAQGEKRYAAASASYARALETMRAKGSPNDRNTLSVMDRYATVLVSLHRTDEARQLRQEIKTFGLR
jgi:tetratricopeptide (TPR) repeat protein